MRRPCERWWGCWKRDAEFPGGHPGAFVHAALRHASLERHFGRARWFLIATFDGTRLLDHKVERNPFQEKKVRAGLAVVNWLVDEMKISAAILREVGEIAYHTFRDHYVEVFRAPDGTTKDVLDAYAAGQLKLLPEPTHSSETKIETEKKPG